MSSGGEPLALSAFDLVDAYTEAEARFDTEGRAATVLAERQLYYKVGPDEQKILAAFFAYRYRVLFLAAMEAIEAGDGARGELYLSEWRPEALRQTRMFPSYLYWYGRAAYARGDNARAVHYFLKNDQWMHDDEWTLFYLGNAYVRLGRLAEAKAAYVRATQVNAGFSDPKENLLALERGEKALPHEQISLADLAPFLEEPSRCYDLPIFINGRDRLGCLRYLIDWLREAGYHNLHILDNDSTYPPLLAYYRELEAQGVYIWYLRRNLTHKALWFSGLLDLLHIDTPYVYTDPDILPDGNCPRDVLYQLAKLLARHPYLSKVGLSLHTDDITFYDAAGTQEREGKMTLTPMADGVFEQTDTTFALYRNRHGYSLQEAMRTGPALMARHLPWYYDYENLPEDEQFYMQRATNVASTVQTHRERQQKTEDG